MPPYRDQLQQEKVQFQSLIKEEKAKMQHQIQEERVKMQRQVAMFQEDILRKEEEHIAEVSALNLLAITITPKPGNKSKEASSDFRNQAVSCYFPSNQCAWENGASMHPQLSYM